MPVTSMCRANQAPSAAECGTPPSREPRPLLTELDDSRGPAAGDGPPSPHTPDVSPRPDVPGARQALRPSSRRRWLIRYGGAVGAAFAGLLVRWALEAWVGPGLPAFLTFYPPVMAVALLGGLGPGLVATVVSALLADYWVIPPHGFRLERLVDAVSLAFFLGMGGFMSLVADYARLAGLKAAAYDRDQALRETRRQNEFLADVIERAAQPFAVGYPDGRIGLFNAAFEELTGYTAQELRSMDWASTLTPPEWREMERRKLEELRRTGQPVRYEKEYVRKDGRRVPIELLVDLARDANGEPEYYYSFLTDITERKQGEEAFRKLNAELERRVAEQTAEIRQANEELEQRVRERTAELQSAKEAIQASRTATLSLLEDALEARAAAEQANAKLQSGRRIPRYLAQGRPQPDGGRPPRPQAGRSRQRRTAREPGAPAQAQPHPQSPQGQQPRHDPRHLGSASTWPRSARSLSRTAATPWSGSGSPRTTRTKSVRPAAYSGFEQGYLETLRITWADTDRGRGPTGTAIRTGQPCHLPEHAHRPGACPLARGSPQARAMPPRRSFPVLGRGQPGLWRHFSLSPYAKEPDAFSEDEIKLLTQLADDVAYCIPRIALAGPAQAGGAADGAAGRNRQPTAGQRFAPARHRGLVPPGAGLPRLPGLLQLPGGRAGLRRAPPQCLRRHSPRGRPAHRVARLRRSPSAGAPPATPSASWPRTSSNRTIRAPRWSGPSASRPTPPFR